MRRVLHALVAAPLLLTAACGGDEDKGEESAAASKSCDGLLADAKSEAEPPDMPKLDGATYYEKASQGATNIYFAYVEGDKVVDTRDDVLKGLEDAGYSIKDKDSEGNVEAEAEFEGKHEGSVQVIALCKDHLRIRYRLAS